MKKLTKDEMKNILKNADAILRLLNKTVSEKFVFSAIVKSKEKKGNIPCQ